MKGLGTIIWLQLLGIISAVTAINPQFQRVTGKITAGGAHQVEWTETGLGNNQNINYRIEAGAASTWACFNNAGKISNKQNFREPVEKSVTHNSGKNGRVDAVEIIGPVPPSSGFSCPPGQDTFLLGVSQPPGKQLRLRAQLFGGEFSTPDSYCGKPSKIRTRFLNAANIFSERLVHTPNAFRRQYCMRFCGIHSKVSSSGVVLPKKEVAERLVEEPYGSVRLSRDVKHCMEIGKPTADIVYLHAKKSCQRRSWKRGGEKNNSAENLQQLVGIAGDFTFVVPD
ncbi:hypothetical protein FOXYS1_1605 [Fusarium oxysporum]|uniref:Uncharacterized protein n=1 Tax=Fusarium oxysporum TaxID=5507 RepID=A0A8H5ALC9_FUSOX|nr:hypothetical protein FOXYS1_1605 [Fusarium oxysporum]